MFNNIFNNLEFLAKCTWQSKEHPVYHPEGVLNYHILLVAIRALLFTNNRDLVLAAFMHDLHKPTSGGIKNHPEGAYWSNYHHDTQAAKCDVIGHTIWSYGGDVTAIRAIIAHHMVAKHGKSKKVVEKIKNTPHIHTFTKLDDMIGRSELSNQYQGYFPSLGHQSGLITFVAQANTQYGSDQFTICIDGRNLIYKMDDIPKFFTGRMSDLRELADLFIPFKK